MVSQYHFERLMRRAANSADAVVPVVSFPSILSNVYQTKGFFRDEWANNISSIVITKLKTWEVKHKQKEQLSLVTWGCTERSKDVICCDSLFGLGGLRLLDHVRNDQDIAKKFRDKSDPTSEV
jgi:hypothetical protein